MKTVMLKYIYPNIKVFIEENTLIFTTSHQTFIYDQLYQSTTYWAMIYASIISRFRDHL